jgi:hypothetical protein
VDGWIDRAWLEKLRNKRWAGDLSVKERAHLDTVTPNSDKTKEKRNNINNSLRDFKNQHNLREKQVILGLQ